MNDILSLYDTAQKNHIDIDCFEMKEAESLSLPLGSNTYGIAIDPQKVSSQADEKVKLAHEIGHCVTRSFYNQWSAFDLRQKHENRADKWAIRRLVPVSRLDDAVAEGYDSIYSLAQHFNVTEEFMRKALCYYVYGNLAVELYF